MGNVTFDDFQGEGMLECKNQQPLFTEDYEGALAGDPEAQEKLLQWLNADFERKVEDAQPRLRRYRENVALYKGIHFRSLEDRNTNTDTRDRNTSLRSPKVVMNWIYDMVENKTARLTRYKPAITFMPTNDEYNDKNNCKVAKMLVDSRWYDVDIDTVMRKQQKGTFIYGEAYIKVFWNPDIGPLMPQIKNLEKAGIIGEELNKTGAQILDKEGRVVEIKNNMRVGDVDYKVLMPSKIFPQIKETWEEVEDLSEIEYMHVDKLKAMFPEVKDKIHAFKGLKFDPSYLTEKRLNNEALMITLYVPPNNFIPKGLLIKYTEDTILSMSEYPYIHGKLPFCRLTDIDVPDELFARSFLEVIRQPQMHYNNLASGVARNHGLASAPKWVAQKGSCKLTSLGNDSVVIEYTGPIAPRLEQLNPTPSEVFNYMDKLETNIVKLSAVHGSSRGELPPGVDAALAMERLDEQEAERSNVAVVKRISTIKDLAKLTSALQGQYYKDGDDRMIRILGKDNSYLIKSFKAADFSTSNDVRVQNTSALPESKALRVSSLVKLAQAFPNVFQEERVIDMLDLGAVESFKDKATVAVKAAESENESILMGEQAMEPKPWEDLSIHYEIHLTFMQERQFKEQVPSPAQIAMISHIKATEYLMWAKATSNAMFMQSIMARFPQFPVFFRLDPASAQMIASGGMPPQQEGADLGPMADEKVNTNPLPGEEAKLGTPNG